MKKLITLLVTIAMIGVMLTGCGGGAQTTKPAQGDSAADARAARAASPKVAKC